MEEEANSWIRRTKFSPTVCHRMDSSKLASVPFAVSQARTSGLIGRPETSSSDLKLLSGSPQAKLSAISLPAERYTVDSEIQRNPVSHKERSVSPLPRTVLPDVFKEARSDCRSFSSPHPKRKDSENGTSKEKWFRKDSIDKKSSFNSRSPSDSPIKHLGTLKIQERVKTKKEIAWTKYFDHGGRRVNAVESADEYGIDMSKLYLGLRFAHGLHSRLYRGKYNDEPVAVKLITVPDDDENGCLRTRLEKQFTKEVTLLSRLYHPNVIKFVGACKDPPAYCVITEYLPEGSLRSYLHKLKHKSFFLPLQKLIAFALDIARGMEYIHSQHVIHRDLKPENVLIDEGFHLKIADFGIACEEEYCDLLADDPGTYRWMAPEMIKRKPYGRKADVYSFGLVLWEMVAGTIPYEDMNPIQAAFAVVHKNMRPTIPAECPVAMRAMIEQCWTLQPDKRPEFWQIVKGLEQFQASVARDGNLDLLPNRMWKDHKKGLRHWIQKLGPIHHTGSTIPKPKFA